MTDSPRIQVVIKASFGTWKLLRTKNREVGGKRSWRKLKKKSFDGAFSIDTGLEIAGVAGPFVGLD